MEVTTYARQISDRVRQILSEIQSTLLEKTEDNSMTELSIADYIKRSHILVSMRDDFQGAYDEILKQ